MNLLATEKIIWTVPAPSWARKKVRELGTMLGDARQAERELLIASLPPLVQYRLTFQSATMREEGLRSKLLRDVTLWFEEKHKLAPNRFNQWFRDVHILEGESNIAYPEGESMSRDELVPIYLMTLDIGRWATVMVCLSEVATRQVSMTTEEDDLVAWKIIEVPGEWMDFERFVATFPSALFDEMVRVCDDLNPGVWTTHMDDNSKNFGGVSVMR